MQDRWMTVKEAATHLSTHPQFMYEACATLGLCHARIGNGRGHIRIRQSWLDTWCAARASGPLTPLIA